jgi:hypothetical protein
MLDSVRRPFGIQMLAALLALYAMGGVFIALTISRAGTARVDVRPILVGSVVFALAAGVAAQSVWQLERRAAAWVGLCGLCGAGFCVLLALAAPPDLGGSIWTAAILGAVMFLAFLLVAALYVHRMVRDAR